MKPVLHQGRGVHRADEQCDEHEFMAERRPVDERRNPKHHRGTDRDLNQHLHGAGGYHIG